MSAVLHRRSRDGRGFTLVELMVVVAILAIVAAFAVQSYRNYGLRARRADAHQALMGVVMAQERYYTAHQRYTENLADIGFDKATSAKGYYTISLSKGTKGAWFNVSAKPAAGGPQAKDDCKSMDINDLGQKSFAGHTTNGSCLW